MLNILNKILGNGNEKEIKKLQKTVDVINALEPSIEKLSDSELRSKTDEFKERLSKGETLDDILPEAFAVVREASKRTLNMRPFDVQIMGGIVLHQGRIAEMKTGEGKTLVATMPVYLNALTGQGVHIVTVNDYLAKRDSEWMGKIYNFLGLEVGLIVHDLDFEERKKAYNADITYGTNNEFGFDYLRDNMVLYKEHMVQRPLNYAIVDEVDSILIDEARTPLIISGQAEESTDIYYKFARFVPRLVPDEDYTVDEKAHSVMPTEKGIKKAESFLGVENLYDEENMELLHHLQQALKAHALMKLDRDYVVKDGQVIIVDEFTGRLMFGRRYSDGLHQAIEAKEGVKVENESKTLATITFQNYFRMYKKLAGMTGTAATEEEEFRGIYGLDVVVIPTNKPMIRTDYPDAVYKTEKGKFNAVVEEIQECHRKGRPVLVGTISIEKSELLSSMLKRKGIPHQVLNAKYHEKEAQIIAQAGQKGAVTIATNMAGRGTDIVLGEGVAELGGLHIIGTERHESRRIDNQLRGRSGRQGDPGSSRFYISLEDDLMRLFGADNIKGIMDKLGLEEDQPIEHPLITKSIESAQKKVEAHNFDIRKHVLEYDDVMNTQREVIYSQRRHVLESENLKDSIMEMIAQVVGRLMDIYASKEIHPEEWDISGLSEYLKDIFQISCDIDESKLEDISREDICRILTEKAQAAYEKKEAELGSDNMRELERYIMLKTVDQKWMDHIDAMDQLREGIGLRAYGQRDPVIEYKFEGYEMFQDMIKNIQEDTLRYLFRVRIKAAPERQEKTYNMSYSHSETGEKSQPIRKQKKIGRNDPCPCGSGKKYKKCCGRTV
ncbi:translocase binding subunit (ATPase) [Tepidanaerobacter acetatoxydans Re1]|uniref:Protein translocase subunit SecA n=1 Tax=Tepidanaerobacter acetatoxydans (strain DSM 21804 / JCM 16047 / Re1) TaxID=1209989 RepID=F4LX21_TEPAE|nr:preprotein translocase subunit SecA [Tepidanaerobacter acetatoxydans]AEE90999.1 Protein translocase subunit secA [Tepidanaerobacter acetatoxydans Re1]CCP25605.1 translocase binding subunit (ATPase) [Tepidanaerobacter acetatoxydans Re1]